MDHTVIPLLADAGVPMIFLTFPAMVILLLPIIILEAQLFRRWLGIQAWTAIKTSALTNIASTLVGLPVAWAVMLCLEFSAGWAIVKIAVLGRIVEKWHSPIAAVVNTILSAAWLVPDEKNLYWMVPVAVLVLMIPTFYLSVWIEAFIVDHMVSMPEGDPTNLTRTSVRRAVRDANLVSYSLLTGGTVAWLLISLLKRPR
jgi:hypothetical protein